MAGLDIPLTRQNDVRMQVDVVRHDDRPEHGHPDQNTLAGERRYDPVRHRARPIGVHDVELHDVAQCDHGQEGDYHPLEVVVLPSGDQQVVDHQRERCSDVDGDVEQERETERRAEVLRQLCGRASCHDRHAEDPDPRTREPAAHVRRQRPAADDAEASGYVLQEDEHQGAEGDDPQELEAELAAAGDVGRPVAWVYEPYGDDEAGAQIAQQLPREQIAQQTATHSRPAG